MSDRDPAAKRFATALLAHAGRLERAVIAALAVAALGLFAFVRIAGEVAGGETRGFDEWLLLLLRNPADTADPLGPAWLEEAMRDMTALGSTSVLTFVTLAAAGFLAISRKRHAAMLVIGAVVSGVLLSHALKLGFARPRPDLVPHGAAVYTPSFPSGHAMLAAVTYLTLGVLLARTLAGQVEKVFVLGVALLLTAAVGVSRVYLGVHWPSDVLAGWALGASWALLCWLLALWLQSRGAIEDGGEAP